MSTLSLSTLSISGSHSGSARSAFGFVSFLLRRWEEHKLMRSIESLPYDVMKDIGFPAAEQKNEI